MSRDSHGRKSEEQVREAVALIIAEEVSDPRLDLVTVTGVKTSPDRSVATIYVSADPDRYDSVLSGLESAKGRIRSLLGRSLGWRTTPELRFFIDEAIDEGSRIEQAIASVYAAGFAPTDQVAEADAAERSAGSDSADARDSE